MLRRTIRVLATAAWVAAVVGCLATIAWVRAADAIVVIGGSMEPAVPRGSLIAPTAVPHDTLEPGDVVTVRSTNGVLVTHRITRVIALADGPHLELAGDANAGRDGALVPVRATIGRVDWHVPALGYLAAMLSTAPGMLGVVSLLGAGAIGVTLLGGFGGTGVSSSSEGASGARAD